jgi:hypothetical protein
MGDRATKLILLDFGSNPQDRAEYYHPDRKLLYRYFYTPAAPAQHLVTHRQQLNKEVAHHNIQDQYQKRMPS